MQLDCVWTVCVLDSVSMCHSVCFKCGLNYFSVIDTFCIKKTANQVEGVLTLGLFN